MSSMLALRSAAPRDLALPGSSRRLSLVPGERASGAFERLRWYLIPDMRELSPLPPEVSDAAAFFVSKLLLRNFPREFVAGRSGSVCDRTKRRTDVGADPGADPRAEECFLS